MKKNIYLVTVLLFALNTLSAQCNLTSGSYSSQGIANLFKPSGPCPGESELVILDAEIVTISGQWDFTSLGIQKITIQGSGSIVFGNNDDLTLVGSAEIIVEDPSNSSALDASGVGDPTRILITIGSVTYNANDFPAIISGGGANSGGVLLDVELTNFNASLEKGKVYLNWQTASEENNYGFEVERKTDKNWETITFVEGKGNSAEIVDYTYEDLEPDYGQVYYRLKAIDYDGEFEYSKTISVDIDQQVTNILIAPNPTSDYFYISMENDDLTEVQLYNMVGQQVFNTKFSKNSKIDVSTFDSGIYIFVINYKNILTYKKVNIIK